MEVPLNSLQLRKGQPQMNEAQQRRPLKVVALVPYAYDTAPGQRFRIEQWARLINPEDAQFEFLPFETPRLNAILYQPGRYAEKALHILRGTALRVAQAFIPLMKSHDYGRIVNLSSSLGCLTEMGSHHPAYRISKTALNALTRVLAADLMGSNILVNAVCPGWVKTEMGGPHAERPVEEAVDTILWLATLPNGGPTGGFFRDRQRLPW